MYDIFLPALTLALLRFILSAPIQKMLYYHRLLDSYFIIVVFLSFHSWYDSSHTHTHYIVDNCHFLIEQKIIYKFYDTSALFTQAQSY